MGVRKAVRIVEIRPAMGGDDAALFASELCRAYLRYAQRSKWVVAMLDRTDRTVVLRMEGFGVEKMEAEAGTHRVTRIPSNERNGRRHTSAVTVAVLPIPTEIDVLLKPADLRIDITKGSGPGGQNRNKTETAVRVTHKPTGLTAYACDDRSQHVNRARALEVLAARVAERAYTQLSNARDKDRAAQHGTGHIADRQRSYLWREGVAVDHRTGVRVPLGQALDGYLGAFADREHATAR
jgi:peptide chain release factor 1